MEKVFGKLRRRKNVCRTEEATKKENFLRGEGGGEKHDVLEALYMKRYRRAGGSYLWQGGGISERCW